MTATTTPRWLAGLIAAYGEPLIVRPVYDMSTDTEYVWPDRSVRVGESWGTWFVVASRHGGRVVNLGGLEREPTDADISGVVALSWLDDGPSTVAVDPADLRMVLDQSSTHYHQRPGVWDPDNRPELANRPCVECAARERLRVALAGLDDAAEVAS